jgi:glutamate formiminotransferase
MKRLIECVPNFSEGRDIAKVDAIVSSMSGVAGVYVLDRESDADHNRSVVTIAGDPEAVAEGVLRGVGKAMELIDLTTHTGAHPRVGATDVVPFIPIHGIGIEDCRARAASGEGNLVAISNPGVLLRSGGDSARSREPGEHQTRAIRGLARRVEAQSRASAGCR